jgi:hypothetical protein
MDHRSHTLALTDAAGAAPGGPAVIISRSAAMTVRRTLHALRDGWLLEDRLRRAARMIAEDARRHRACAEQMVVALKREWPVWVDSPQLSRDARAQDLARRLVTLSIHEFYASSAADGSCAVRACRGSRACRDN